MPCRTVRNLLALVLTILVGPWLAAAQGPTTVPRLGVLSQGSSRGTLDDAFFQALHDLGYREGDNLHVDYRFAAQQLDRLPTLAAELVVLQPDVIFVAGTPAVRAAQQATTTIPIVVGSASDLVTQGLVASYARPGGNITGLTLTTDVIGKRIELLKEAVPTITRLAVVVNPENPASALISAPEIAAASRALGIQVQRVEARHADELDAAFRAIVAGGVDALFIMNDGMLNGQAPRIAAFAHEHRLPTTGGNLVSARAGGLMAYSVNLPDMFRRAAVYVDKILKGAKPADLPVERADKFVLVINLKTAKALGLTIPPTLLLLADEVIQ